MLRAIEHLHRIINRAAESEALPEPEIKRARACLGLIHAEHHAELSRLLLARAEESQARLAAERECGRLRQQVASWRSAAEAAWETLETSLAQVAARRPSLRLIERPPLLRHRPGQGRECSGAEAGEEDPSPFFWPKIQSVRFRTMPAAASPNTRFKPGLNPFNPSAVQPRREEYVR